MSDFPPPLMSYSNQRNHVKTNHAMFLIFRGNKKRENGCTSYFKWIYWFDWFTSPKPAIFTGVCNLFIDCINTSLTCFLPFLS